MLNPGDVRVTVEQRDPLWLRALIVVIAVFSALLGESREERREQDRASHWGE